MSDTDFAGLTEGLCIRFWGKPTVKTAKELRWGSGGSRKFSYDNLVWFDHEAGLGGGAIDLVMRECSTDREGALAWMQKEGLIEAHHAHSAAPARQEVPQPNNEQAPPESPPAENLTEVEVAHWDYTNRDGEFRYRVVRYHYRRTDGSFVADAKTGKLKKTFKQKSRDASGRITFGLNGRSLCLYRWPAIELAVAEGRTVFVVEGEKAADALIALGFEATCNSGGAGKDFHDEMVATFKGAKVVVLPDNDPQATKKVKEKDEDGNLVEREVLRFHADGSPVFPGQDHAEAVAAKLRRIATSIKVLDLPGLPLKGDVVEWIEAGGTHDELQRLAEGCAPWRPRPPRSAFGAQTSGSIAKKPVVYDWLVKHLIERNGILILAGESMAGKSFLIMDMGMKIARGLEYAGHKVRQGAVIHMAVEDGKGTELRHKGYRKANGISPDADVPYVIMDPFANNGMGFSLMNDEHVDKFIAECLEWKEFYGSLEFIIIDTLSMATEGMDENSSGEASKVLGRINRIRERTGATVAVVHHMNAGGTKVRGSTAIVANVPNVIELRQQMIPSPNKREEPKPALDGEGRPIRRARLAKNKNGVGNKSWAFVLEEVKLDELDEDGEPFSTMVCVRPAKHGQHESQEDVTRLQGDQKLVFDALVAAQADSTVTGEGSGGKAVAHNEFVAAVRKRMSFRSEEPKEQQDELTSFLKRTTTALMNAGYMGRDNDKKIVWWTGKSDRPRPPKREPDPPPPPDPIPEEIRQDLANDPVPF